MDGQWQETELIGQTDIASCVKINEAGKFVLSGSVDKSVRLWEMKDGKWDGTIIGEHSDNVIGVAVNENWTCIVSTLWEYTQALGRGLYKPGKVANLALALEYLNPHISNCTRILWSIETSLRTHNQSFPKWNKQNIPVSLSINFLSFHSLTQLPSFTIDFTHIIYHSCTRVNSVSPERQQVMIWMTRHLLISNTRPVLESLQPEHGVRWVE